MNTLSKHSPNRQAVALPLVCLVLGALAGAGTVAAVATATSPDAPDADDATVAAPPDAPARPSPFALVGPVTTPPALRAPAAVTARPSAAAARDPFDLAGLLDALDAIGSADAGALPAHAALRFEPGATGLDERLIARTLYARWASVDVDAALASLDEDALPALADDRSSMGVAGAVAAVDAVRAVARVAPGRADAWLEARRDDPAAWTLELAVATDAARDDPASALAAMNAHDGASWGVLEDWIHRDPDAVAAWLADDASEEMFVYYASNAFGTLLRTDADAALRLLDRVDDPEAHGWMAAQWAGRAAEDDPAAALAWLSERSLGAGPARRDALGMIGMHWAQNDPDALQAALTAEGDPAVREGLMQMAGWGLGRHLVDAGRVDETLAWSGALGASERARLEPALFEGWLETEPARALDWLRANEASGWGGETGAGLVRPAVLENALPALVRVDPGYATALYPGLDDGQRTQAAPLIADALADEGPAALDAWIGTLEPGRARDSALLKREAVRAVGNPEAWIAELSGLSVVARTERRAALMVDGNRLHRDEAGARLLAWVEANPPTLEERALLERRMRSLYSGW